jgi:hypothetical protein
MRLEGDQDRRCTFLCRAPHERFKDGQVAAVQAVEDAHRRRKAEANR